MPKDGDVKRCNLSKCLRNALEYLDGEDGDAECWAKCDKPSKEAADADRRPGGDPTYFVAHGLFSFSWAQRGDGPVSIVCAVLTQASVQESNNVDAECFYGVATFLDDECWEVAGGDAPTNGGVGFAGERKVGDRVAAEGVESC